MSYSPISTVNISLQTSGITSEGFGIPLFIADVDTDVTADPLGVGVRVKTYSNLTEVAVDWDVTDAAYIAASGYFSNSPSVQQVKIAYRDIATLTTETPAEAIAAVEAVDNDWYFLSAESHTTVDVVAYATAIEAREKMYFFSSADEDSLTAYDEGVSIDALAEIKENNFNRTKGFFHHAADGTFPECILVGFNAPFLAGSVSWSNLRLGGVSASQDPSTGVPLSTTQKGYLETRDAGYTERLGPNTVIFRNGSVGSGEYIDNIRGRDSLESDLNTAVQDLLVAQKGGKLPYSNAGITRIQDVVDNVLNRYSQNPRNFILPGYRLSFPLREDVPIADVEARVYQSGTFTAVLQGAIESSVITGTLTLAL